MSFAVSCSSYRENREDQAPPLGSQEETKIVTGLDDCDVGIFVPFTEHMGVFGTGVIIHSSERGTFILTNAHVATAHPEAKPGEPELLPTLFKIILFSGDVLNGEYISSAEGIADDGKPIDLGILWVPYDGKKIYPSFRGLDTRLPEPGEAITVWAFEPRGYPNRALGFLEYSEGNTACICCDPPIEPGNSGSGIYSNSGILRGLVFAYSKKKPMKIIDGPDAGKEMPVGYMVCARDIKMYFDKILLGWALTPDPSDDPPLAEK